MACEDLKTKYDALEARLTLLNNELTTTPKPDQGPLVSSIKTLSAQAWAAGQAFDNCLAAQNQHQVSTNIAPQNILQLGTALTPAFVAQATAALRTVLLAVGDHEFPLKVSTEWIQPLPHDSEYEDTVVGVSGWAVNPRVVFGDFPFSHPFENSIGDSPNPFDFEVSLALDRPTVNPGQFDFLLTEGNKAPSPADPNDTRAQDENYANDFGFSIPLGLMGVEIDSANLPRDFINQVQSGWRLAVFGRWIIDCGHALPTQVGSKVPRAEIHPPLLMVAATTTDALTTQALFTSRALLVGETFTSDLNTIYDDNGPSDGTFLAHLGVELAKVNDTLVGIPLKSVGIEAHPKIKSMPFRGENILHVVVRPPARSPQNEANALLQLELSYCFTVRGNCSVEVTSSAPDTIDVYVLFSPTGYPQFPLPANATRTWTRDQLTALEGGAETDYLAGSAVSAALQLINPTGGLIAAGIVDLIISQGIKTDAYASLNDAVTLSSTKGAVNNVPVTAIPPNAGVTRDDTQPFPVVGWMRAQWVEKQLQVVSSGQSAASTSASKVAAPQK